MPDFKTTDKAVQAEKKAQDRAKRPRWQRIFIWLFALGCLGGVTGIALVFIVLAYFSTQIPSVDVLANYQPSLVTKIYDEDGEILAEYAKERRIWIPIRDIPTELIEAYLAAEDTNFYNHGGYNPKAILRAAITNVLTGRKHGASTITQQVAKTYLLSSERTYTRKIKELLISRRIERTFSKDEILELYLNRIYLGYGAYGVGSAAQTYFSKTLPELELGERALLAGLPKAPSRYDPVNNPNRAKLRRDIILRRMQTENFITKEVADAAVAAPIKLNRRINTRGQTAPHFAEYIRRQILADYGEDTLYEGGLTVYTTLNSQLQAAAQEAIQNGLIAYDKRHGYRGPIGRMKLLVNWEDRLAEERRKNPHFSNFGQFAVVLEVDNTAAQIGILTPTRQTKRTSLPLKNATWARTYEDVNTLGPRITKLTQVLEKGDIILVTNKNNSYHLSQYPAAQAALVAIDIPTGAIRAMVGGTDAGTGFNRAIQGERQVGSAFKPIIYAAALEAGYTPATTVLDAPIVVRDGGRSWKPKNYSSKVYGPSPLRRGLEKSLNLMTVRIAQDIGIPAAKNLAMRLGLPAENMGNNIAMALGTAGFSLLDITNAYAIFPRLGQSLAPHSVTRIQDATGTTLKTTHPACNSCLAAWSADPFTPPPPVTIATEEALAATTSYQMVSMLQGVFTRGTASKYGAKLGPAVAGKTGTTDNAVDGWFIGFTPNLAVGVWFGFDTPQTTGRWESGGKLTLPIWSEFVQAAQKILPRDKFTVPNTVNLVQIDTDSGKLPGLSTQNTHLEAFAAGTEPTEITSAPTGGLAPSGQGDVPTFGIY